MKISHTNNKAKLVTNMIEYDCTINVIECKRHLLRNMEFRAQRPVIKLSG